MDEQLELCPGSGFWLCIDQKNAREITVEVSELCHRRYQMLSAGSPYARDAHYEHKWDIFER
jgi:hypothetical protein